MRWITNQPKEEGCGPMSNYEYEDDDDFDFESQPESGNAVKELRKANRTKEKALKEMTAELESLRQDRRQRTIKEVLGARGVNEKIAKFIPQDIDSDEESVSRWLDENADVFGFEAGNRPEANADPADIKNYQRMQNTVNSGSSANASADLANRILNTESPEELKKLLAETGL
jgi:hypothetical protein